MNQDEHNQRILDQFSKQAIPFSKKVPAHSNATAFKLIIDTVGITWEDTVLDIACGPGMMSTAIAQVAGYVTGIDLVPSMIEQARLLEKEKNISNINWHIGDVTKLPFTDDSFTFALTRFSFHHFLDPFKVLKEMQRVAREKVAVIDVVTKSPEHSHLHNLIEKLRDDSHVKALSLSEFQEMFQAAGLENLKTQFYNLEIELGTQLSASFPKPGDADKIRQLVMNDKEGLVSERRGEDIYLIYPIAILVGEKS